jgi:hypothetical protein
MVIEPLSHDGIDAGTALTDELVLAAREVVVAGPACDDDVRKTCYCYHVWDTKLTSSQEIESVTKIALVASEEQSAIFARRLRRFLRLADLRSVRDAATDDDRVVVTEIGSGPHLAGVCREGTLVVRLARLVVEVVGLVQCGVIIVVRVLVDGCSVSPTAHEEGSELLGWLCMAGSDWRFARFDLEPTGIAGQIGIGDMEGLMVVTYLSNSGTFCWSSRMTRKLPSFAQVGWPMVSPSCPQKIILERVSLRYGVRLEV